MTRRAIPALFTLVLATSAPASSPLDDLATVVERSSHRASSHDLTGGNVDNIESFAPGATHTLLDIDGPGRITHLWFTIGPFPNHPTFLRDLTLRIFWEHSAVPSVEVPLGDFFALGHARQYTVESLPIAVGINSRALNCYWPMPFQRHARVELVNNSLRSIRRVYYNIDYELGPMPPDQGLFHALYRRDRELRSQSHTGNTTGADNYVILDTAGTGHYVGCALFIDAQPGGWWGEGDDMIFIDDDATPSIIGTGSEDYFCNAWGYNESFSYPFYGAPLLEKRADGGSFTTVYRWHIADPVRFRQRLRVTIEHLFGGSAVNDYSSVAYWYQTEPIAQRELLPFDQDNHPRPHPPATTQPATSPAIVEVDGTELEPDLLRREIPARAITASLGAGFQGGGWLRVETGGKPLRLNIPVPAPGSYRLHLKPVGNIIEGTLRIELEGGQQALMQRMEGHEREVPYLDLGVAEAVDGRLTVILDGSPVVGIDHIRLEPAP